MKTLLTLITLFIAIPLLSQNTIKYGEVSQTELEMEFYEADKKAGAVILFDYGKSEFIERIDGLYIKFTRHKRIKIFKKSAFQYADVSIPLYVDGMGKKEEVTKVRATTYNYENKQLATKNLNTATIYDEKLTKKIHRKKFTLPNVKEGSILEYEYTLETPFLFNLPDWVFQDKVPTVHSQYQVKMVPFYEYVRLAQGITKFDFNESVIDRQQKKYAGVEYRDYVHTVAMKNIPAFNDESYITSIDDYIMKLDFQLSKINYTTGGSKNIMSTWPKLNQEVLGFEYFGGYIKSCRKFAKKILENEIDITNKSLKEKTHMLSKYVKDNFVWNGYFSRYASQSAKEFFTSKTGNTADINLFLVTLLNEADIKADPLLISTRDHGKVNLSYPFTSFFNYVIAVTGIDSRPTLLDGTENHIPYNLIPPRCINGFGLLVSREKEAQWLNIEHNAPSLRKKTIVMNIKPETNTAETSILLASTDYEAYAYRKNYENNIKELKQEFTENAGEITELRTFNYNKPKRPYLISLKGKKELSNIGGYTVIKPFMDFPLSKNKLTQETRTYPVDMIYPTRNIYEVTINITDQFKTSSLPNNTSINNDLVSIQVSYSQNENLIKVLAEYTFKKSVYQPSEYKQLKAFMDTIVEKFNEEIVLESAI